MAQNNLKHTTGTQIVNEPQYSNSQKHDSCKKAGPIAPSSKWGPRTTPGLPTIA